MRWWSPSPMDCRFCNKCYEIALEQYDNHSSYIDTYVLSPNTNQPWEIIKQKTVWMYLHILLKATMSQLWTYSLMGSPRRCSLMRLSTEARSSTIVSIICSFLMMMVMVMMFQVDVVLRGYSGYNNTRWALKVLENVFLVPPLVRCPGTGWSGWCRGGGPPWRRVVEGATKKALRQGKRFETLLECSTKM